MKKLVPPFLVFLFLFCNTTTEAQQQNWNFTSYAPHFRTNNAVQILHSGRVVAVGGNYFNDAITSFFLSDDSTQSWGLVIDSVNAMMNDLHFPVDSVGYAIGNAGLFYKTTNEGTNWSRIPLPGALSARDYSGIHFTDPLTGIAVGGTSTFQTIMRTTDGGISWSPAIDGPGHHLNDVTFVNPLLGFAVGDSGCALKTQDGGISWLQMSLSFTLNSRMFQSVCFINSSTGFIAGGNSADSIRTILKTINGGTTWNVLSDVTGSMAKVIYFLNDTSGYIGGEDGLLLYSSNQGMNWTTFNIPGNDINDINDINFLHNGLGVASGIYGKTLFYYDSLVHPPSATINVPVTIVNPHAVLINGMTNAYSLPTTIEFEYGLTNAFGTTIPMNPSVSSANNQAVSVQVNGLTTFNAYYGRIKVSNSFGTGYSNTVLFYADSTTGIDSLVLPPNTTINSTATIINSNSVQVDGIVNAYQIAATVEFDYGLTPAFGTLIPMTPSLTNNNNQSVSVVVTGLSLSNIYYGRIKVTNQLGVAYSNTISFYTDSTAGLNFSFENWNDFSTEIISQWGVGAPPQKVLSYDGSFACHLISQNQNSPGAIFHAYDSGQGPPTLGLPFAGGRPDTLIFHSKYDIELNDTALVQLFFNSNGMRISDTMIRITGTTGAAFQTIKVPIHYNSTAVPDSIGLLMVCTNFFSGTCSLISEMTIDNIFLSNSTAQINNSDMENWNISTRNHAVSWYSNDDMNYHPGDSDMVRRSTNAYDGNYALQLRSFAYYNQHGVSMKSGPDVYWQTPDFPVFVRHTSFNGVYILNTSTQDTLTAMVNMYKLGVMIGGGYQRFGNSVSGYTHFVIPINYYTTDIPDSASVQFFMGKNDTTQFCGDSWALLDDLGFDAVVTSIAATADNNNLLLFPNPAQQTLNLLLPDSFTNETENFTVTVFDMNGKKCLEESIIPKNEIQLDVSGLREQLYFIEIRSEDRTLYSKLIIQR